MVEKPTSHDALKVIDAVNCCRGDAEVAECGVCFRTLCDRSLAGIFIVQNNAIRYSNPSFAWMLGYEPHALDGVSPLTLFHPNDRAEAEERMSRCLSGEVEACNSEACLQKSDGETVCVELFGSRLMFAGSAALMSTMIDVTDRKRAEHALEERWRFERLLADLSASFVNVSFDRLDALIGDSMKTLVEALGHDRSTLAEFDDHGVRILHSHTTPGNKAFTVAQMSYDLLPWYFQQLREARPVLFDRPEELPAEAVKERQFCVAEGIKSHVSVPLLGAGKVLGALNFSSFRHVGYWKEDVLSRVQLIGEVFANAVMHKRDQEAINTALAESERLREQLENENVYLREQVTLKHDHARIVGESRVLNKALAAAEQVAETDTPVLLLGETGTGKELFAQHVHSLSKRNRQSMVVVNCASLPATLIESELFGREAGAYTGAASAQIGRFEMADGSTLFLDEIGELPTELQAKLLRVIEDGRFQRLGSPETRTVDVRVIAATNRDLEQATRDGAFRADLYHRLNVFPIRVPPLRERREDIPVLAWSIVEDLGRRMGKKINCIPRTLMDQLQQYTWPGNVRELRNVIERGMILTSGETLYLELPAGAPTPADRTLDACERDHILRVLEETAWRVRGAGGASEILGVKPTTLESRMARLGITRPGKNSGIS